ncbi:MAG: ABC transporter permease [Phycisphaerae bacterium]|nr:MAG: ABC transporter permease [Phycisphaerae bacterium]
MKADKTRATLRYVILSLLTALLATPLIAAVYVAVMPVEEIYAFPAKILPTRVRWSNFGDAIQRLPFMRFMFNSLVVSVSAVIGAVLTSAMAGYAFARLDWKCKPGYIALLMVSLVIPAQILLIPQFLLFSSLGWVNSYKPLIVPAWLGGGAFNVFLFWQFFRTISRDFDDAAKLDGASHWTILTRIMIPMAKPATATVALLSFVYYWQDFQKALIYLSDFRTYTVAVGLRMYQATGGGWINLVIASSLIALLPVLIVFLFMQRAIGPCAQKVASESRDPLSPQSIQRQNSSEPPPPSAPTRQHKGLRTNRLQ